jgi:lipopolysaccharide export system protein LptA
VKGRFIRSGLVPLGLCIFPALLAGQARNCELARSEVARPFAAPDGTRIVYVVRPVLRCNDGAEIRADSAVMWESSSYSQFFRNVFMRDGTRVLQADTANYQDRFGMLNAQGHVRVNDSSDGTNMTGDRLNYLRANPQRSEDVLTMEGGTPTARFTPKAVTDSAGVPTSAEPPRPVELTGRWIRLTGSSLVQARGLAHLKQDSLDAYGDSLAYDQSQGVLSLFRNARILSPQAEGDTMDLRGDTIIMRMPNGDLEQLDSSGRARLLGASVKILGPVIKLFFEEGEVARVVSTIGTSEAVAATDSIGLISPSIPIPGMVVDPTRPEVTSENYEITGDSVEVLTPGGQVSNVFSAGDGRAVSTARDSINSPDTPEILLNDWIEGDSIRAFFEPASGQVDTEASPSTDSLVATSEDSIAGDQVMQIRRLVATGNARSLSRFQPDSVRTTPGDTMGTLNVNYVSGTEIRIFLVDGEVDDMEVDEADGLFLQPTAGARVMGDSTTVPPDTLRPDTVPRSPSPPDPIRPDTTVLPDTTRQR